MIHDLPDRLMIVDTETTHYRPALAAVVEIAAVVVDTMSWVELAHYESLCNPGEMALVGADTALEISGLTKDLILAAPPDDEVAEEFRRFVKRFPGTPLTGYNTNYYDSAILVRGPWNIPLDSWLTDLDVMLLSYAALLKKDPCPLEYMPAWQKYKWPRLEEAARYYGVLSAEQDHRALSDCRVTARLLRAIVEEANRSGEPL